MPSESPFPATQLCIRSFAPEIAERWDSFADAHPRSSFFHLTGWKLVIEKTFDYQACYFYCERDGKITGIAPVFYVSNWLVGRCLLSVPLGVYGGICAADAESEQALLAHLKQLAAAKQVEFLELRNRNGGLLAGFHPNSRYVSFTAPLSASPEENLKRLPRDTRYMIRKAQKAGLRAQHGFNQLDEFYRLFAESMRWHGTPVFPKKLLENLRDTFAKQTDLLVVYHGSKAVAGVLSFLFRDTVMPYYAGAGPEAPRLAANNFLYWALMNHAAQAGLRWFDFGRSKKGTGSYAFKTQWNMHVEPLDYQVHLLRRKDVPNFSPANPKFEMATRVWKRLPLWLTVSLGPRVVRWFP